MIRDEDNFFRVNVKIYLVGQLVGIPQTNIPSITDYLLILEDSVINIFIFYLTLLINKLIPQFPKSVVITDDD